jgi:hypothetical protein
MPPRNPLSRDRGPNLRAEADDLDEIPARREERKVARNLTLRYDPMMLLLDPTPIARELARQKVEVVNYPDGPSLSSTKVPRCHSG